MTSEELRHCKVETARARDSVKEFFVACVPFDLRKFFTPAALRHQAEKYSQVEKLKRAMENPSDIGSHNLNCSWYVKESKTLIRSVSFVLLRAFPNGAPSPQKEKAD